MYQNTTLNITITEGESQQLHIFQLVRQIVQAQGLEQFSGCGWREGTKDKQTSETEQLS
jgi:hypothetical protein